MKKLTAGIFTIMLGLIAVDANAAITSKAYVDDGLATKANSADVYTKTDADAAFANKATQTKVGTADLTTTAKDLSAAVNELNANKVTSDQVTTAIEGAITGENGAIKDAIDAAVEGKADKSYVDTELGKKADDSDLSALDARVTTNTNNIGTNTTAIATLNGDASTAGSVAKAIADEVTRANGAYDAKGDAAQALTDAKTYADGLAENYDAAGSAAAVQDALDAYKTSNNAAVALKADKSTIGDVAEGKTVVQMINEAETAAKYNDAEVKASIKANADAIDAIEASDVMTSGATKAKIDAIATNTTAIEANTAEIAKKANTTDLSILAKATIPAACATGECVLKYTNGTYSWEPIDLTYGD